MKQKTKPQRLSKGVWEQDGRLLKGLALWPAVTYATTLEPAAMLEGREFSKHTVQETTNYLKNIWPNEPFTPTKVAVYLRLVSTNHHIHTLEVDNRMAESGGRAQPVRTIAHYQDAAMLRTMAISLVEPSMTKEL